MSRPPGPGADDAAADLAADVADAADRAEVAAERAEESAVVATAAARSAGPAGPAAAGAAGVPVDEFGRPGKPFVKRNPFYLGFVGALGALTAWFLFTAITSIGSVLMLIVVSMFLAAGLDPAVRVLQRRGLSRAWACAAVIVAVLLVVVSFVLAIVPVIADQTAALTANVPHWVDELERNERVQQLDEEFQVLDKAREYVSGGTFISGLFGGAVGVGLAVLSALFNAFVVVVLTLYFLASLETTKQALFRLAPASRRERVTRLGDRIVRNIGGYVSGAVVVGLCAGLTSLVFLFIIGLGEYAVALAVVVALLDLIPMIGATIGAVAVTAIAFASDVNAGIACIVFYVIYQQVENYVIYPRVMRRSVDVPGAVTVIAALIGTALLGVVGALLAVPTAAAILLLLREVVVRNQDER
ncbi:AI-2E family transporter [Nocardioides litoris]|uniref:AI-2E family transporter n=1 Tax=Nocardioides litoris TaxID=1926648 RepID=UPI001FEC43CD|nr:AI-2E family transporter [Nocardioides litoris]